MIIIVSSAKTMDTSSTIELESSKPLFEQKKHQLLSECIKLSPQNLSKLMHISDKIAALNYDRFQRFALSNLKQALLSYNGDVFKQLDKTSFSKADWHFAQEHLLIAVSYTHLTLPTIYSV